MIQCPGCGSYMKYDPDKGQLYCDHCENMMPVHKEDTAAAVMQAQVYHCPSCGGEIMSDDDTAVTFCSYCQSPVELEGRLETVATPKRVIPFAVSKRRCEEYYRKAVKRAVFAPKEFRTEQTIQSFRGIYMPYWVYRFSQDGKMRLEGKRQYNKGNQHYSDTYTYVADTKIRYDGIGYDASSTFSDELSNAIAPYDLAGADDFATGYMSGFYADTADLDKTLYSEDAWETAQADMIWSVAEGMRKSRITPAKNATFEPWPKREEELDYFPVWFLSTRVGKRISYAVINGQTGKAAMEFPIDYKRYLMGSVLLALPFFILLNLFFTSRPATVTVFTVIFAIFALLLSDHQLDRIYIRTHGVEDKGLRNSKRHQIPEAAFPISKRGGGLVDMRTLLWGIVIIAAFFVLAIAVYSGAGETVGTILFAAIVYGARFLSAIITRLSYRFADRGEGEKIVYRMPPEEKLKYRICPVLAIVSGILLLIVHPIMDYWYYGGALVSMVLVLITFGELVKEHNDLTLRVPPQLQERGGDE